MASISRQELEQGIRERMNDKGSLSAYFSSIPLDDGPLRMDPGDVAEFSMLFWFAEYNRVKVRYDTPAELPANAPEWRKIARQRAIEAQEQVKRYDRPFKESFSKLIDRLQSPPYSIIVTNEREAPPDAAPSGPRQDATKTAVIAAALDAEAPGAGRFVKMWADRKAAKEAKKAARKQAETARAQSAASNPHDSLTDGGGIMSSARSIFGATDAQREQARSEREQRRIEREERKKENRPGFFKRFFGRLFTKRELQSEDAHVNGFKRFLFAVLVFGIAACLFWGPEDSSLYTYAGIGLFLLVLSFLSSKIREEFLFTKIGLAALLLLFAHAVIAGVGFTLTPFVITVILSLYLVAIVLTVFSQNREYNISMMTVLLVVTIFLYAMPWIAQRFIGVTEITDAVTLIVTLAPIWALFYLHQVSQQYVGGYASGLKMWYAIAIAIIVLLAALGGLWGIAPRLPNFDTGVDAQEGVKAAGGTIVTRFTTNLKKVMGMYDRATDPGAYYTGKVEENKKAPNGVTIESFRPQDKNVNNESEVIIHGVVNARSFMGSAITVQPACLIDRKGAPEASVDPPVTEVIYGTGQTFTCTFPPLANGQYSVKGSVTFPFETWAYIEYTFVDEERARNLARQQLDVNTEFDIPETPTAIFTSGPLLVGMGGSTQPILIKPEGPNTVQPGTKIGITLDPAWEGGKLQRVDSIELKVPKPFVIPQDANGNYRCDRNLSRPPEQDIHESEYTNYVFDNPDHGPLITYTSLTCAINITSADDALLLVSERDKTVRSFIAVAHYTYTVETKTSVLVK